MKDLSLGLNQKATEAEKANKEFFKKLKKKPPGDLDEVVHQLHDKVFNVLDCLECANCCRTLGPRLTDKDIERLSKFLRIKPSVFTAKTLRMDEEGDYVFKEMPCPYLLDDNKCMVYEQRPRACREFPHTDRKKFYQLLDLTVKNTFICPAVYEIVEEMKKISK